MANKCKYQGYDNCGPKQDQDDFCVFHKPYKNKKEQQEFYKELKMREGIREETATTFGLPGISQHSRFVFEKPMDFSGYYFPKIPVVDTSFSFGFGNAVFKKG